MRVMLVDDHALVRSAVRHAIEGLDVSVVEEAATASAAMEGARRSRPDVVLVDINLGGTDGIQLVRELSPLLPNSTIIILSASASEADLLDAIMAGAQGYLTKDVSPEALLRALHSARRGELAMPRAMAGRLSSGLPMLPGHGARSESRSSFGSALANATSFGFSRRVNRTARSRSP